MNSAGNSMLAAVLYDREDLRIERLPVPQIEDDEVLLHVGAAAVCGTDLRIFRHGHGRLPRGAKRILGHEMAGEVVKTGKKVSGISLGMRVAVAPNFGCGRCRMCLRGWFHLCPDYGAIGLTRDGGFAEYVRIPGIALQQGALLELPGDISFEEAALNEPLACVYNGFLRCPVNVGDTVLVIGAGPIGLMHVMLARAAGARRIIVGEISPLRLENATAFGASDTICTQDQQLVDVVKKVTGGAGADVIVIACPAPEMQEQSLEAAADHARVNFFGGLPKGCEIIRFDSNQVHYKELTVTGSHGCCTFHCHKALELQSSKRVDLKPLITNVFELSQAEQAFCAAMDGSGLKIIIKP